MKPIQTTIAAAAAFAMKACTVTIQPPTTLPIDPANFDVCADEALNNSGAAKPDNINGMWASATSIGEDDNGNPYATLGGTTLTLIKNGAQVKAQGPHADEALEKFFVCYKDPRLTY